MLGKELTWFFETHNETLRKRDSKGYEMLMFMSLAHIFGHDTAKELADHLGIPHQKLYKHLKTLSLYQLKSYY